MKIIIDDREPPSIETYLKLHSIEFEKQRLEVGDFVVGNVIVEREKLEKLLTDQQHGTLFYKIKNLHSSRDQGYVPIFVLEGLTPPLYRNTRAIWSRIQGIKLAISLLGIPIISVNNKEEFMTLLRLIIEKARRTTTEKPRLTYGRIKSRLSPKQRKIDMLRLVEGIGLKKAEMLVNKYKTIKKLTELNLEELVPLIGKRSSENLIETLTR